MRVTFEIGPKGGKVVAVAPDWPGLERGAKTAEAALERLRAYLPRYERVAALAGMDVEFAHVRTALDVVEEYPGNGSTDFWGISFTFSNIDRQDMSNEELTRELKLMQAGWALFDDVRSRVSAELRQGPRGGGRPRDLIVRHVVRTEQEDFARKVGLRRPELPKGEQPTDEDLRSQREEYSAAIRAFHGNGEMARTWPLRYLIRHTAYHTLDHTWEMEDRDLTAEGVQSASASPPMS
jgi:hypothetical protein